MGVHLAFVYGDPKYYGGFGFAAETAVPYVPPYALEFPSAWRSQILQRPPPHTESTAASSSQRTKLPVSR
eukprot:scaffold1314_cov158-Amphora_coffeaeformis.AAC.13